MNPRTEVVESAKECSSKPDLVKGKATVCIVNYKTLDLIRLCLRCISKFARYPYEVIVVDNDSQDESLEYLRSINRIRLIERLPEDGDPYGGHAHAAGLDLGHSRTAAPSSSSRCTQTRLSEKRTGSPN